MSLFLGPRTVVVFNWEVSVVGSQLDWRFLESGVCSRLLCVIQW